MRPIERISNNCSPDEACQFDRWLSSLASRCRHFAVCVERARSSELQIALLAHVERNPIDGLGIEPVAFT